MTIFGLALAFIRLPFLPEIAKQDRVILKDRAHLAAENLALRQQLAVAQQGGRRPKFPKVLVRYSGAYSVTGLGDD